MQVLRDMNLDRIGRTTRLASRYDTVPFHSYSSDVDCELTGETTRAGPRATRPT